MKNIPSTAKRAILDAPILLNKGSLACISDTDCCMKLSPVQENERKQKKIVKTSQLLY